MNRTMITIFLVVAMTLSSSMTVLAFDSHVPEVEKTDVLDIEETIVSENTISALEDMQVDIIDNTSYIADNFSRYGDAIGFYNYDRNELAIIGDENKIDVHNLSGYLYEDVEPDSINSIEIWGATDIYGNLIYGLNNLKCIYIRIDYDRMDRPIIISGDVFSSLGKDTTIFVEYEKDKVIADNGWNGNATVYYAARYTPTLDCEEVFMYGEVGKNTVDVVKEFVPDNSIILSKYFEVRTYTTLYDKKQGMHQETVWNKYGPIVEFKRSPDDFHYNPEIISSGNNPYHITNGSGDVTDIDILGCDKGCVPKISLAGIFAWSVEGKDTYAEGAIIKPEDFVVTPVYDVEYTNNGKIEHYSYNGKVLTPDLYSVSPTVAQSDTRFVIITYEEGGIVVNTKVRVNEDGSAICIEDLVDPTDDSTGFICELSAEEYTYDGNAKTPDVILKYIEYKEVNRGEDTINKKVGEYKLKNNTDYYIEYQNNINAGNASAIIRGMGKYYGTIEMHYIINKKNISDAKLHPVDIEYTGEDLSEEIKSQLVITDGKRIINPSDYEVVLEGNTIGSSGNDTSVTISAKASLSGNYKEKIAETAQVNIIGTASRVNIRNAEIEINSKPIVYNGKENKPVRKVIFNNKKLKNKDYELFYLNNTNAGTAKAILIGKGDYYGRIDKEFIISKAPFSKVKAKFPKKMVYTKYLTDNVPILKYKKSFLKNGVDFVVEYPKITKTELADKSKLAATISISPTVSSNYIADAPKTIGFTVGKRNIKDKRATHLELEENRYEFSGKSIIPSFSLYYNNYALKEGIDYVITYINNDKVGTAKAIIEGIGIYSGKKIFRFKIYN